jgi:hypothetical protein
MAEVQQLGSTYSVGDALFETCFHQCTKCGVIFRCQAKVTAKICSDPFYHGRCDLCKV